MRRIEPVLLAALTLFLLVAWRVDPAFLSLDTQLSLSAHVWETALVAAPMALIVLSAGIDLSVGSLLALSAVTFGLLFERGAPVEWCAAACLCVGLMGGALNGLFVSRLRIHPLIVTLATMAAFRGIAEGVSLARPISKFPDGFLAISGTPWVPACLTLVAFAALGSLLSGTVFGRHVRLIGYQERVALFAGVNVARAKMFLYALSGFTASVAALLLASRRNTAKADLASGFELEVITAVVLGGVSIEGGRGSLGGVALGLALVHEIREFVSWHFQREEWNPMVIGSLLILAVLAQRRSARKQRKGAGSAISNG